MNGPKVLFIVILLASILLAGCQRPIPTRRVVLSTQGGETPEPLALTRTSLAGQIAATLTAAQNELVTTETTKISATTTITSTTATAAPLRETATPAAPEPTPTRTPLPTSRPVVVSPTARLEIVQAAAIPASVRLNKGEFPWCIARRYNINPRQLLRYNGLNINQIFYPGQILDFPPHSRPFPGNRALRPHPSSYSVRPKDTIYSVACLYGDVDPLHLAVVNGIVPPYRLIPGQVLNIP